ncbi:3'-5' exonuclease family protein [Theileria parva strain Muguga]|uniref:3'-5' exonuclease family protein n=1 Tax=Theileria parva strain Muguga TaxID=333668 RepID=UPI001C61B62E|nr:3'-5' exonuclease family protein [Theileria parva strain Muguga]EAN31122.2 3'-5' exonuclease family protein [Theileria parva strain Muguga]
MDLFVDAIDSKIQASDKYQKGLKINKKRKKSKSDGLEEKNKPESSDNKQDKAKSSSTSKNDRPSNTGVKKGDKPSNSAPKKNHKLEHSNVYKKDRLIHSDNKREKLISPSPKKYKPGNSNFKPRGKSTKTSTRFTNESKESTTKEVKSPSSNGTNEFNSSSSYSSSEDKSPSSDSSKDEEPSLFLNTLIASCTEVVRSANLISNPVYREFAATPSNSKKLSHLKDMYEGSVVKIENMIRKLTSDHVFDENTSYVDVLFDEIECGLKKHNRTEYSRELSEPVENTKLQKKPQSHDNSSVKTELYRTEKGFKNHLLNLENSILTTNSIDIDLRNYITGARPQDQWKNHYDNFSTRFHNHSRIRKFNKIEPQVNYSSAYRDTKFFDKGFVPKIYPKHEFLSLIDKGVHVNPHLYSQELNSLYWSEDKKHNTHQGFNILGGSTNNLLSPSKKNANGVSLSTLSTRTDESSPDKIRYKIIDNEADFNSMLDKLKNIRVLSLDVEHHDTETYRGFICLVQLSTPEENYIIDPFKIFGKMNKLNRLTTDPKILKIMHGASNDVVWLQRDFNIFVVNLFDTREAAKVLNLAEQSLAKLIQKYFNIKLNKRFQLSDWSKRPLDAEMLDYACCDSHYLIPLYSALKDEILSKEDGRVKIIQVMNNGRETCLKQYVDRGPEIYKKFKSISKRHKIRIPELDFVSYNLLLNLIAFRNFLARKLDKSEKLIIRDYQIALIIKRIRLGNYNYLVSNLCEFFSNVKFEIEHVIKIKNSIVMICKKLRNKELMLIKPESMYYIMSSLDMKGGDVKLEEFNKLKHSLCIHNTIKVYNKFVVGGFFNNVSPAEHYVNQSQDTLPTDIQPTNEPTHNEPLYIQHRQYQSIEDEPSHDEQMEDETIDGERLQCDPTDNTKTEYISTNYKDKLIDMSEDADAEDDKEDRVEKLDDNQKKIVENADRVARQDDNVSLDDIMSEDENKRSLVEESNLLSRWKRKKL